MMRSVKFVLAAAALLLGTAGGVQASGGVHIPEQSWPHNNLFSTIDQAAARRGFQVFKEVCNGCHSLDLVSYRTLRGIGFTEDQVKAIAADYKVKDGPNDQGEMFERPALPHDRFNRPFPNDNAARVANGGALPPDLSLIAKARRGGEDYLYALLTGWEDAPAGVTLADGMYYNKYFPGHQIAMPKIVNDDGVTYTDGTKATAEQIAKDVSTFLVYAAEPRLDDRKTLGIKVILFLLVFSGLMYATKRQIWRDIAH